MNIVYFGSSEFSKEVLEGILDKGIEPSLVVTAPDKPQGRGLKILPTPLKEFSKKLSLNVISAPSLRNSEFIERLKRLSCDLFLVVSYGNFIPKELLSVPKVMPLALHPSLLPKYRGAAPIQWVLINGEKETGVTVFKVTEKLDAGPVLSRKKIFIEESDDFISLSCKLINLSSRCIVEAIKSIEKKSFTLAYQDDNFASYAPKLQKEDGKIDWNKPAKDIKNLIKGLRLWPGAYTFYKRKMVKILEAEAVLKDERAFPSEIINLDKEGIFVATGEGILKIKELKPEGKKEMSAVSFICGHKPKIGERFGVC